MRDSLFSFIHKPQSLWWVHTGISCPALVTAKLQIVLYNLLNGVLCIFMSAEHKVNAEEIPIPITWNVTDLPLGRSVTVYLCVTVIYTVTVKTSSASGLITCHCFTAVKGFPPVLLSFSFAVTFFFPQVEVGMYHSLAEPPGFLLFSQCTNF